MENGGMLPNFVCWGGLEAYWRGMTLTSFYGAENGKKNQVFGGHQHIISSMHGWRKLVCYLFMPFGVAYKSIEEEWLCQIIFGENGKNPREISMESQEHIFTIDLIFSGSNVPCRGVLCSVNSIFTFRNWLQKTHVSN